MNDRRSSLREAWTFPPVLQKAARGLVQSASGAALKQLCRLEVNGRGNIPWNCQALVVANHVSHLDAGVVCLALGQYARTTRIAAAADYFFDSPLKASFFKNCTDLVPIHRAGRADEALEATQLELVRGRSLLIFPEGGRNTGGVMRKFRPGVGHLALSGSMGILPVWHTGTLGALPKGRLLPRRALVNVRIGRFLPASLWQESLRHVERASAARMIAALAERAVSELSQGRTLNDAESVLAALQDAQHAEPPPAAQPARASMIVPRAGAHA